MPEKMIRCLIAVNAAAYAVCRFLVRDGGAGDGLQRLFALFGGAPGVLLATWKRDRRNVKEKAMTRVFVLCALVLESAACLIWFGLKGRTLTFDVFGFFARHGGLATWIAVLTAVTFFAFGDDKRRAKNGRDRWPIRVLLGLAAAGGSIGALAGMRVFHHKTRKDYFAVGVPLILITQLALLFYAMNTVG